LHNTLPIPPQAPVTKTTRFMSVLADVASARRFACRGALAAVELLPDSCLPRACRIVREGRDFSFFRLIKPVNFLQTPCQTGLHADSICMGRDPAPHKICLLYSILSTKRLDKKYGEPYVTTIFSSCRIFSNNPNPAAGYGGRPPQERRKCRCMHVLH
jgi:hypothetical protein